MVTKFCMVLDMDNIQDLCIVQGYRSKVRVTMLKNMIFTFTRKKVTKKKLKYLQNHIPQVCQILYG